MWLRLYESGLTRRHHAQPGSGFLLQSMTMSRRLSISFTADVHSSAAILGLKFDAGGIICFGDHPNQQEMIQHARKRSVCASLLSAKWRESARACHAARERRTSHFVSPALACVVKSESATTDIGDMSSSKCYNAESKNKNLGCTPEE